MQLEMIYKEKALDRLELDLNEYDRIFLVSGEGELLDQAAKKLCCVKAAADRHLNILVLASGKKYIEGNPSVTYRQITKAEERYFCGLYFMYEFSDRFRLLSEDVSYGGLFHLVDAGTLSLDEMIEMLVC